MTNPFPVSNCCGAMLNPVSSDEGTSYYTCLKCNKPCDQSTPTQNPVLPEGTNWKEEFRNKFVTFTKGGEWSGFALEDDIDLEELEEFIYSAITTAREEERKILDWATGEDTGSSSNALCRHMLGLPINQYWSAPSDADDRGRCIRLLNLVPKWWDRLDEMLEVSEDWKEQIELIKKEAGTLTSQGAL